MARLHYITHPEVRIDPAVPIPAWGLSDVGRARAVAMLDQPWIPRVARVVSSPEAKALELARVLGDHLGLEVEVRPATGENDRSATGYVPPAEFEQMADQFFAEPDRSVRGWERATDAQARIVAGLADVFDPSNRADTNRADTDIAVIGHGGVGTLWYCWLTGQPIDRRHDQPGQGHYFSVDVPTQAVEHAWRPIDVIEG